MRKNYITLIATLLFSSVVFAQQYEYKLTEINSKVVPDYYKYMYDEANGRLDSATHYFESDGYIFDCTNKYVYDEKGNEVQERGFQKFEGDDFYTYTMYINYTYDDQGRVTSRTNFNRDFYGGDQFILGGVYEYIYEGDKLVQRNSYWDLERTDKFEEVKYSYDEQGRLSEENYYSSIFDDGLQFANGTKYIYNDEGRLSEKIKTVANMITYEPEAGGGEEFTYSADGNIVKWLRYNRNPEEPEDIEYFTFDTDLKKENTLYPVEKEWDGTIYLNSQNAVLSDTVYQTDWTGQLGVYDILEMKYEPVVTTGISTVRPATQTMMQVSYENGTVRLTGVKDNEQVRVYSASGLMMTDNKYNSKEGVDLSSLPTGAYIISSNEGSVKVLKK